MQELIHTYLYRIYETLFENGPSIYIARFTIIKETPCGYWIEVYMTKKFVRKDGKKRYAYTTIDGAVAGFYKRKERQIEILQTQLNNARTALVIPRKQYIETWKDIDFS